MSDPKQTTLTLDDVLTLTNDPCPLCASCKLAPSVEPCRSCDVIEEHGDWIYAGELPSGFELKEIAK